MPDIKSESGPFRRFLNTLGVIFAIFASVATVVGLYIQMRKPAPELQLRIIRAERLTTQSPVPTIKSEYKFNDRVVKDLWRVKFDFLNTGGTTLVSEGSSRNLIRDQIEMSIDPAFELLGFEQDRVDSPTISITRIAPKVLGFKFLQWRKGESTSFTVFLERSDSSKALDSNAFTFERVVVDGEISVVNLLDLGQGPPKPLIDHYAPTLGKLVRLLVYTICAVTFVIGVIIPFPVFSSFKDERKAVKWRMEYLTKARDYLKLKLPKQQYYRLMGMREKADGTVIERPNHTFIALSEDTNISWSEFEGVAPDSLSWISRQEPTPWQSLFGGFFGTVALISISLAVASTIYMK